MSSAGRKVSVFFPEAPTYIMRGASGTVFATPGVTLRRVRPTWPARLTGRFSTHRKGKSMTTTEQQLKARHCQSCEGGVPPVPRDEAERLVKEVAGWELTPDGKGIGRRWVAKDFAAAMEFLGHVAQLAEAEDHHPDLHLVGYRHVTLELSTHAIGG